MRYPVLTEEKGLLRLSIQRYEIESQFEEIVCLFGTEGGLTYIFYFKLEMR